jgi:tetratricopeptide (TPR) repeat protein
MEKPPNGGSGRRRAVVLTGEALDRLRAALEESWKQDQHGRKLTREGRARRLGLSVVTADRILAGKPVDRASLALAFRSLGLHWEESLCRFPDAPPSEPEAQSEPEAAVSPPDPVPVPSDESPPGEESEKPRPSASAPEPVPSRVVRRSRFPVLLGVAGLLLVLLGLSAAAYGFGAWKARADQHRWIAEFARLERLGNSAYHRGDYAEARRHMVQAVKLARDKESMGRAAGALRLAGDLAGAAGDLVEAKRCYREALTLRQVIGLRATIYPVLQALGTVETRLGETDSARSHLQEALKGCQSEGDWTGVAMCRRDLGSLAVRTGDIAAAKRWYDAGLAALEGLDKPEIAVDIRGQWATVLRDQGRYTEARGILKECLRFWKERKHPRWIAVCQVRLGSVECLAGRYDAARMLLRAALAAFERLGDKAGAADCRKWLTRIPSRAQTQVNTHDPHGGGGPAGVEDLR